MMLCDELEKFDATSNAERSAGIESRYAYDADEVDEAIEELKAKLESVQASMYADVVDAGMENRKLKRALWLARAESAKNAKCKYHRLAQKEVCDPQPHGWSCYINGEVYPTGKMSRKLEPHYWCDIWDEVERKCRAKAEQYK